jgi:hypothetical protein
LRILAISAYCLALFSHDYLIASILNSSLHERLTARFRIIARLDKSDITYLPASNLFYDVCFAEVLQAAHSATWRLSGGSAGSCAWEDERRLAAGRAAV